MASLKIFLVLAAMLFATVLALPTNYAGVEYEIDSIRTLDDDVEIDEPELATINGDDTVTVYPNEENVNVVNSFVRADTENAKFAVKKTEAGYARTTRIGITVQKGTSGVIRFRVRAKAVTLEKIKLKAKFFRKSLTKSQQKELTLLEKKDKPGEFSVPWLKMLGIDLKKSSDQSDFLKKRSKTIQYDKLSLVAKKLLKEITVQKIEIKGKLVAKGVSFIPTTVFSFLRLARVFFQDDSKLLVVSENAGNGNVLGATSGGQVANTENPEIELITLG